MLVAGKLGRSWETGREYLKDSVLDLSVNDKGNRRSGAGDRFNAIAILTAVAVGTATEGLYSNNLELDNGENEGYLEVCIMGSVSGSRGYLDSIVGISPSEGIDVETYMWC